MLLWPGKSVVDASLVDVTAIIVDVAEDVEVEVGLQWLGLWMFGFCCHCEWIDARLQMWMLVMIV